MAGASAPPPSIVELPPPWLGWNAQPTTKSEPRSSAPQTADRRRHRALLIEIHIDAHDGDLSRPERAPPTFSVDVVTIHRYLSQ
jgi:hypothetical protein